MGPRPQDIVDVDPRVRIVGSLLGESRSRRRGRSQDVVGSRPYVPGDDVRRIDWSASARLSSTSGEERFVVREFYAEEAPSVVVAVDRAATMALYPERLPWLHKPAAVARCVSAIEASAMHHRCLVSMTSSTSELLEPPHPVAPRAEAPARPAVEEGGRRVWLSPLLLGARRWLPPGTFVFILSDFLRGADDALISFARDFEWELVPIVVSDPLWERSFPCEVGGTTLPLADGSGRLAARRISTKEARLRRDENERRWDELLRAFRAASFVPVLIAGDSSEAVAESFVEWSFERDEVVRS